MGILTATSVNFYGDKSFTAEQRAAAVLGCTGKQKKTLAMEKGLSMGNMVHYTLCVQWFALKMKNTVPALFDVFKIDYDKFPTSS